MENNSNGEINRIDINILKLIRDNTGARVFDSLLFAGPQLMLLAALQLDSRDADLLKKLSEIYGVEKLSELIRFVVSESKKRVHQNVLDILKSEGVINDGTGIEVDPDEAIRLLREWNRNRLQKRKDLDNQC